MKTLILFLLTMTACSPALIEKLSSDPYLGKARVPGVVEMNVNVKTHFGYQKRLIVSNPLDYGIHVSLVCKSMFQADQVVHVAPHRVRYLLVEAPNDWDQSCFISSYEANDTLVP